MKDWGKYQFTVNGFKMEVSYHKRTVQEIFLPLLRRMTHLQKERGGRLLVFMAAPPAAGKTTLCQFLEYLSREIPELTEIQAAGLDGFHYHSDYINSHDAVVQGKTVPMKAVKAVRKHMIQRSWERNCAGLKKKPFYGRFMTEIFTM